MSQDTALGTPFNWVGAAALHMMLAHVCGLKLGEFVWMGTDVHLYITHIEAMKEQISRGMINANPMMRLVNPPQSLFDFTIDHFAMDDYYPHASTKMDVAV